MKNQKKEWNNYRNLVTENKNKSQDDFEKYINILASGAIILSMTFLEKIASLKSIEYLCFFILGAVGLIITLLSNLFSHYKSMIDSDEIIKEIDEEKYNDIFTNIDKRNKVIKDLNKLSVWALIIGVVFTILFISLNLLNLDSV